MSDPITIGPVPMNTTFDYTGVLTKQDGKTPVPLASLSSVTLTLTDVASGQIINSRNAVNILNSNGVTISANGAIEWIPDNADNPWIGFNPLPENAGKELHLAEIVWTWQTADVPPRTLSGSRKIYINVERSASLISPSESGSGSACTLNFVDPTTNNPLVGAIVWVTSDSQGLTRVAGPLKTDINGNVRFMLTRGSTYYLWLEATGYPPVQGQSFTAEAD